MVLRGLRGSPARGVSAVAAATAAATACCCRSLPPVRAVPSRGCACGVPAACGCCCPAA